MVSASSSEDIASRLACKKSGNQMVILKVEQRAKLYQVLVKEVTVPLSWE